MGRSAVFLSRHVTRIEAMKLNQAHRIKWIGKPLVFIASLLPLAMLFWINLGANPVETITHHTGDWGLRFLLITLAVTPLRHLSGWNWMLRFRRMLGLFAFFYVFLHFTTYLVLDQFFDLYAIIEDIAKRPYISVGFLAFLLLIPLALTSTNAMMKRLGGRHWQRLHRLIYVIGILGVLHYLWLVKADLLDPLIYAAVLAALLGYRLWLNYRAVGVATLRRQLTRIA
jgi:sulfoxide reductase heme-binding subunit YedZ